MTDTELYSELRNVITDIVNEFLKGGGDPIVARRMAFDAVRSGCAIAEGAPVAVVEAAEVEVVDD